ncbi:10015_t:CDS:10 [Paraglomus brasilianum]|uniref:10015_t:CDS:1 n=1 Tax=Paraglomus brasilianum TaxID=144538 RepID=A0A9N8ZHP3_9GLOM|nr:10015_t:CDS:10 [Paraglomus brasilianum]
MSTRDRCLFFGTGLASVILVYSVIRHLRSLPAGTGMSELIKNEPKKLENALTIRALSELTRAENINLRNSAIRILLDRAMSDDFLGDVISSCRNPHEERRMEAVITLQLLSRTEENKATLVENNALEVLVGLLRQEDNRETTHRYAAIALCDLMTGQNVRKIKVVELGVIPPLIQILESTRELLDSELKSWCVMVVHQISMCEQLHQPLGAAGFVPILARMSWETLGSTTVPKFCMQALVRILSTMSAAEAKQYLHQLLDCNIVMLIASCLKSAQLKLSSISTEDTELLYWALGLMHEFVVKVRNLSDIGQKEFREMRNLLRFMSTLLGIEEPYISRIMLRALKFLGNGDDVYQKKMISEGILNKVIYCMKSTDDDVVYWSLVVLQDLVVHSESHKDIVEPTSIDILSHLLDSPKQHIRTYVTGVIATLCSSYEFHEKIVDHPDLFEKLLNILKAERELDTQYAASVALFNLSATCDKPAAHLIRDDCISILGNTLKYSQREKISSTCAKALVILALKDQTRLPGISSTILIPLIKHTLTFCEATFKSFLSSSPSNATVSSSAKSTTSLLDTLEGEITLPYSRIRSITAPLSASLDALLILLTNYSISGRDFADKNKELLFKLARTLMELFAQPGVKEWIRGRMFKNGMLLEDLMKVDTSLQYYARPVRFLKLATERGSWSAEENDISRIEVDEDEERMKDAKYALAAKAIDVLSEMAGHHYLTDVIINTEEGAFFVALVKLLNFRPWQPLSELATHILHFLGPFSARDSFPNNFPRLTSIKILLGISTWRILLYRQTTDVKFYAELFLYYLSASWNCHRLTRISVSYCVLDRLSSTRHFRLSGDRITCRNDSWTFETIRANRGVTKRGRYAYEVRLRTGGLVQIGWTTRQAQFEPEIGTGVGDNDDSYSYDGFRRRKWHGKKRVTPSENSYGLPWRAGDFVTCCIDLEDGTMGYWLNGEPMGIAFTNINKKEEWYPAVSLASSQECGVHFGGVFDPLAYIPAGYRPIGYTGSNSETTNNPTENNLPKNGTSENVEKPLGNLFLPLLYYEVRVGLKNVFGSHCLQIGLGNNLDDAILFCRNRDSCFLVVINLRVFTSPTELDTCLIRALSRRMDQRTSISRASDDSDKIGTLIELDVRLKDGDYVGCGLRDLKEEDDNSNLPGTSRGTRVAVFFTVNGNIRYVRPTNIFFFPYIDHRFPRVATLFGLARDSSFSEFKYEPANTLRAVDAMREYVDEAYGRISKLW